MFYFVSPFDIVPDFILGIGLFDDAAVIGFAIKRVSVEVEEFKMWKHRHNENPL
ncbi:DUF1232 domain-containing protein [Bacillus sp. EB600]|uniref:YkvA family protein n=1 Tax=Bacillus sp. EB600 TaxID=2806345 RepID=UPI00210AC4FD|nr:DUF1232 domain-containing protein [Bacillus sp. EB600]MCQ6279873.1 DUF1232 domain-containing protein [Bacillus sp. EB600]